MKIFFPRVLIIFIMFFLLPCMIFADKNLVGVWKSTDTEWEEFLFFEADGSGKWRMPMDLDGTFFSWQASPQKILTLTWGPAEQVKYEYFFTSTGILILFLDAADGPVIMSFSKQK
ncbi:MAG: hypothetical protein JW904_12285 [Spirochaetales bacterium]|nr:hypothetical protein [Spirochaetales bacterium]